MRRSRLAWMAALVIGLGLFTAAGCGEQAPGEGGDEAAGHDSHGNEAAAVTVSCSHEDPDASCFICDPSKREEGRLWCREHNRYEDRCWMCHPELEDPDRLYCKKHGLYEDECHLCHPELKEEDGSDASAEENSGEQKASGAADAQPQKPAKTGETTGSESDPAAAITQGLFCNGHGVPEVECGICQPQLAAKLEPGQSMKVRLGSASAAHKAGVRFGEPRVADSAPAVKAVCEVRFNGNSLAKITPLTDGVVRKVHADVGDRVERGDVLVELHSAEVAAARSAYLSAQVEFEVKERACKRAEQLVEQEIASQEAFEEANGACRMARLAVRNAEQKLLNIGFTQDEIDRIEREEDASATVQLRAPYAGTLVERTAVVGEAADPGDALFELADLSSMWLKLSIPADRIGSVRKGQKVIVELPNAGGGTIEGKLTWIDAQVDPRTRLVRARAVVPNPQGRLRAGLYGEARIVTGAPGSALRVPKDAVQQYENAPYVFVRESDDLFGLRRVTLGEKANGRAEVVAGLKPNESIVVDGGFIVMSEFLKSRLGAGCVAE